uniref:Calmodulin n=1 Tax=Tetraselmis sp. GSL018 TaxID=582737 RepID=A0A061S2P4_9CHLO|mmetsp:Transcript_25103/g.59831  ORF Transcript_25103/g.59831 Transcript_25103/m.59831 type:complete len:199 (-) Transcript_25103:317-913(-)|eukprot:CAMPEP_0177612096 /NCGR_PEP_ID=MMETSP0419_2-20121207/20978_1 /TAXON_ID=582737 /ORGANISM="Tetraselmis sp., Strain GSL018" /LENGTH=198 /DNA_ID=CAMNT_0019108141 /DNA_START=315 /DNA_END=911 /DNA_ORIENTATION=-
MPSGSLAANIRRASVSGLLSLTNNSSGSRSKPVDLGDGLELTEEMVAEFKECFTLFDKSGDGRVSAEEISEVMRQLGVDLSPEKLKTMIEEVDTNNSGELEFPEFLQLMVRQMTEHEEDQTLRQLFLHLSQGKKLVPVLAVRSMLHKLACLNTDQEHKVAVSEISELIEEAVGVPSPVDSEVMTYSQFKSMFKVFDSF